MSLLGWCSVPSGLNEDDSTIATMVAMAAVEHNGACEILDI
jgi:hypothetical protein